jgi:phosphoglucosamine mutase
MSRFPQVLRNVRVGAGASVAELDERLAGDLSTERQTLGDDGRILVRRSGTEPLVRVMVEAPTTEQAEAVADRLAAAVMAAAS